MSGGTQKYPRRRIVKCDLINCDRINETVEKIMSTGGVRNPPSKTGYNQSKPILVTQASTNDSSDDDWRRIATNGWSSSSGRVKGPRFFLLSRSPPSLMGFEV